MLDANSVQNLSDVFSIAQPCRALATIAGAFSGAQSPAALSGKSPGNSSNGVQFCRLPLHSQAAHQSQVQLR